MMRKGIPATLLLMLHASILWESATQKSASVDEMSHLAAGLYSLSTLDFRINRTAPPMQNLFCALPVALFADYQLSYDNECWENGIWNGAGDRLLEANQDNFHRILMLGRCGTIFLSVLLCLAIFLWAYEFWGYVPALFVLLLAVLEPNIMAHGRLTTTDIAPTLFFLLCGFFFWRFSHRPSRLRLSLVGIGFGLAWYSKHSGGVLLPAIFLCFLLFSLRHRLSWLEQTLSFMKRCRPVLRAAVQSLILIAFVSIIGLFVIWAGYGFEIGDSIPGPREPIRSYIWGGTQVPLQTFVYLLGLQDRISLRSDNPEEPYWLFLRNYLPAFSHWEGFFANRAHLSSGHLGFFMGELSSSGWKSYYPVLFLIKTPVPLLLILLAGVFLICKKTIPFNEMTLVALLVIPLLYAFVLVFFNTANIGYRHALPIVPFFLVSFGGAAAAYVWKTIREETDTDENEPKADANGKTRAVRSKTLRIFLAIAWSGLTVWYVVDVLSVHPHYLEYFNSIIGGPKNGHYYAVDSNLDWGQDLLCLKAYLEERNLDDVRLLYFGPKEYPDVYNVPHQKADKMKKLEPGTYVVSASFLHGIGAGPLYPVLEPLRRRDPDEYITYAFFLYRVSSD